jgi:hypothetical protein
VLISCADRLPLSCFIELQAKFDPAKYGKKWDGSGAKYSQEEFLTRVAPAVRAIDGFKQVCTRCLFASMPGNNAMGTE